MFSFLFLLSAGHAHAQSAEVVVQTGHTAETYNQTIRTVYARDDSRLVTHSKSDGRVIVWDLQSGRQVRSFSPKGTENTFGLSADGRVIAFTDSFPAKPGEQYPNTGLRLVDLDTGADIAHHDVNGPCKFVALTPDGSQVSCIERMFYDQYGSVSGSHLDHRSADGGKHLSASPDIHTLLSTPSYDGGYTLFGPDQKHKFEKAHSPAFHPDSERIYYYVRDDERQETLTATSISSFEDLSLPGDLAVPVAQGGALRIARDGKTMLAAQTPFQWLKDRVGDTRPVGISTWSLDSGEKLRESTVELPRTVSLSTFSQDGKWFSKHTTIGIDLYSSATGQKALPLTSYAFPVKTHAGPLPHLLASSTSATAGLIDLSTGHFRTLGTYPMGDITTLDDGRSIAFDNNGQYEFWDVLSATQTRRLPHSKMASKRKVDLPSDAVVISPDGTLLHDPYFSMESTLTRLWDTKTGVVRVAIQREWGDELMSFTPDSSKAAFVRQGYMLTVNDVASKEELWRLELTPPQYDGYSGVEDRIDAVALLPDGGAWVSMFSSLYAIRRYDSSGHEVVALDDAATSMAITLDGELMAAAFVNSINVYDREGVRQYRLDGGARVTTHVDFTRDGRYLLWSGADGETRIHNARTGERIATLVVVLEGEVVPESEAWGGDLNTRTWTYMRPDNADFVLYTPDNYFLASRGALKGVSFRVGGQVFAFEQFDLRYNRPDIVLGRLGYAEPGLIEALEAAYQRRLRRHGFTEDMLSDDFAVPQIAFAKSPPTETATGEIQLSISASDENHPLDRIAVYVDDVPIHGAKGIRLSGSEQRVDQVLDLSLPPGQHTVQVSAYNRVGVESLRETVTINCTLEPAPTDLYVVSIGVSSYATSEFDLKWAAKDAQDIAALFEGRAHGDVHSLVLTDAEVTRERIDEARTFLEQAGVADQVVVFLAGHGVVSESRDYYFATHDLDFSNPADRGLPYESIEGLVDGLAPLQKLVLMDTCHSGEIDKDEVVLAKVSNASVNTRSFRGLGLVPKVGSTVANGALLAETFADLRRGTGAVVLSSSSGSEFSYEDASWQNGVFTYAVREALSGKAGETGKIKVSALQDYVSERVRELTDGKQNPTMRRENLALDFIVF